MKMLQQKGTEKYQKDNKKIFVIMKLLDKKSSLYKKRVQNALFLYGHRN